MNLLNIPEELISSSDENKIEYDFNLTILTVDDKVKFNINGFKTSFMDLDDRFINRIQFDRLNPCFIQKHLSKEIEIKNILDEAIRYIDREKFSKAVELFDEVIYFDENYAEAIFYKSKALFFQKHFVKSLRHYKKAIKADLSLKDIDYHKLLLKKSSEERDNFPKIKRNIYAGDEYFAKGEFEKALESYEKALANPSKFKDKILYKLLNKKATSLFRLNEYIESYETFLKSLDVFENDYACFGVGNSLYESQYDNDSYKKTIKESLKGAIDINQRQLLKKASIFKGIGEFEDSLECIDEFLNVHFSVDKDYLKALNLKLTVLNILNEDTGEVELILSKINGFDF